MLDIAWTELLIIAIVAIVVVGPRELPRMLRSIGNFMGMVRRTAGDFQRQFNDALRETELDEVRRGFESVRKANPLNKMKDDLNPLKQAGDSVRKAVEDPGAPKPRSSAGKSGTTGKGDDAESDGGEATSSAVAKSTGAGPTLSAGGKHPARTKPTPERPGAVGYAEKVAGNESAQQKAPGDKAEHGRSAKPAAKTDRVKAGSGSVE